MINFKIVVSLSKLAKFKYALLNFRKNSRQYTETWKYRTYKFDADASTSRLSQKKNDSYQWYYLGIPICFCTNLLTELTESFNVNSVNDEQSVKASKILQLSQFYLLPSSTLHLGRNQR